MDFLKTFINVNETKSTMDLAKELSNFIKPPFITIADIQTSGRGQYGRPWESQKGGLWLTECFLVNNPLGLSAYAAIPIVRAIDKIAKKQKAQIKWPNDIIINNKKVAGILVELRNSLAFVGIGINIENDISKELSNIAINLKSVCKVKKDIFFMVLLNEIENSINEFLLNGFSPFREEYINKLILIGKEVTIKKDDEEIAGIVKGVGENGELILQTNNLNKIITYGTVIKY